MKVVVVGVKPDKNVHSRFIQKDSEQGSGVEVGKFSLKLGRRSGSGDRAHDFDSF